MTNLTQISVNKSFGGNQKVFSHESEVLGCKMKFAIYLPPKSEEVPVPVIYWLSGLTCTEENFIHKAGAQRIASDLGLIIVCPDTSPRGLKIPGEDDSYDFGSGAGFYVDATVEPWSKNYKMYSYVTKELPEIIKSNFPVDANRQSIFGHSMGGHGALICALKNPGRFRSVSAFAPICNPTQSPWGKKAFTGYLGADNKDSWKEWDATELAKKYDGPPLKLFIDQGKSDDFLTKNELLPENLVDACKENRIACILNMRNGYDHSYYYIASFIEEHLKYHHDHLQVN